MVKGKRKVSITVEDILKRVSTYDTYRFYQGPFKVNTVCVNKLRGEKDPSLIIGNKITNELTHKDFGDYSWRGNCFNFVQQANQNCDFLTALRIIDRDFGLGIMEGNVVTTKPTVIDWKEPEIELKRPPLFHIVYYSKMSQRGLDYWAKLGQGEEDLKREHIYQPKEIWRNRKRIPLGDLLTFVYFYEEIDSWKIYRPFAPKKTDKASINQWKWDSNVPFDYIDNIKGIKGDCPLAILAKSKKDRMVLMKALGTDCIADVQAEDPACLSIETLDTIKKVSRRYIVSDNDKKGKEFSWWLTKEHQFKHVNVPDKYFSSEPKCTDFADLCYHYGIDVVIEHFKNKKII
jgi:hypothetical protein